MANVVIDLSARTITETWTEDVMTVAGGIVTKERKNTCEIPLAGQLVTWYNLMQYVRYLKKNGDYTSVEIVK